MMRMMTIMKIVLSPSQTCEKEATEYSEMSKHDQDPEPYLLSKDIDETAVEQHDDGGDDDTPVWNTPRTRHLKDTSVKNKDNNLQSPRTFVNEHMTFLRSKALLNWKRVDESAEQYSDEDFEELDERSNSQVIIDTKSALKMMVLILTMKTRNLKMKMIRENHCEIALTKNFVRH